MNFCCVFFCCCCWKNKPQRSLHFLYNYIDDWTRNPHAHINRGIHTLSNVLTLTLSVSSHSVCFLSFIVIVFFHCMRSTKCKERATYQNAYCHNGRYWKQKIRKNGIYITQISASIQKKEQERTQQTEKKTEWNENKNIANDLRRLCERFFPFNQHAEWIRWKFDDFGIKDLSTGVCLFLSLSSLFSIGNETIRLKREPKWWRLEKVK